MLLTLFTQFHVLLSLIGIGSGFVVTYAFLNRKRMEGWTQTFLATNIATSVTGFFFPFHGLTPALVLGVIALATLGVALWARKAYLTTGDWGGTCAATMVLALYFNVFVLIVQSFQKIPFLNALAPTQTELPFQLSQLLALLIFAGLIIRAAMKTRNSRPLRTA